MSYIEKFLLLANRFLFAVLVFCTPLIIATPFFFPYITGKNFFFRIVVEMMLGIWCVLAVSSPEYRPKPTLLFGAVTVFIGSLVLATLFGVDPYHSFWSNYERMEGLITFLHLYALFVVLSTTMKEKSDWYAIGLVSLTASVLVGLYGTCEHFFYATSDFCKTQSGGERIYSTFGNFIYLGVYTMIHMFLAAILFRLTREKVLRIALVCLAVFNLYIFTLAGSRGASAGLIAGIGFMLVVGAFLAKDKKYRIGAIVALVAVVLGLLSLRAIADKHILPEGSLISRIAILLNESGENLKNQPRVRIWGIALKAIQERPILGWGPENFVIPYGMYYDSKLYTNEPWFDRVHNMSLQWLVDAGIIGFLAYVSVLVLFVYSVLILVRRKSIDLVAGLMFIGIVVAYVVQNLFVFDTITNYIFFFSILAFFQMILAQQDVQQAPSRKASTIGEVSLVSFGIMTIALIFFLNVRPILANTALLGALQKANKAQTAQDVINAFQEPLDYGTFATTETRERLADFAAQIGSSQIQNPAPIVPLIDKAISELEKESQENPLTLKNYIFLGRLYTIKSNWSGGKPQPQAEAYYQKGIALAPNYTQTYLGLAEYYIAIRDFPRAEQAADKALSTVPDSSYLFRIVLSVYVLGGDYDGATKLWAHYVDSGIFKTYSPTEDADIKTLVSRMMFTDTNLKGRIAFMEHLRKGFDHPIFDMAMAETYAKLGDRARAREFALHVKDLEPSLAETVDAFLKTL